MENAEARLSALLTAQKEAQAQLAAATAAGEADRRARAAAERAAEVAEAAAARQQREAEQRVQRAEAAAAAAAVQVSEFRRALAGVERERDELAAERAQHERAAREAAAAVASARRRTGDGGLAVNGGGAERAGSSLSLAGAGSAALPSPGGGGGLPSPLPSVRLRDTLEPTDVLYLKNVLLRFLDAHVRWGAWSGARCEGWICPLDADCACDCAPDAGWGSLCGRPTVRAARPARPRPRSGRAQECEVLLPAVATLLRASPAEYRLLREHLQRAGASSWLPALPSLGLS